MVHVGLFLSTRRKKHPDLSVDDFCQQVRLPQNRKKLQEGRQKLIEIRAARGGKARLSQKDIHDIGELITVQKRKSDQLEIIDPDDFLQGKVIGQMTSECLWNGTRKTTVCVAERLV